MKETELTQHVIKQLGKHAPRDPLAQEVCQKGNMSWPQAKTFIRLVQIRHRRQIGLRQRLPALLMRGTASLIGLIIAGAILVMTLNGSIIFFLSFPIPYLGNLVYFGLGAAMSTGGLKGTWKNIKQILKG